MIHEDSARRSSLARPYSLDMTFCERSKSTQSPLGKNFLDTGITGYYDQFYHAGNCRPSALPAPLVDQQQSKASMTAQRINACVFDAYGTLFDVHSAVARHASAVGKHSSEISMLWRTKQLEYSWVHSLMRRHVDFWKLTESSLAYALAFYNVRDEVLKRTLLDSYLTLDAYPEVPAALRSLREAGVRTAILSNGSPSMLDSAVRSAGLSDLIDECLSIEHIQIYKPDPAAYEIARAALGGPAADEVAFCSSNAWDAVGAHTFGFRSLWLNRSNQPEEYGLYEKATRVESVSDVAELLLMPLASTSGEALATRI
jgi:2-haloacid dehalogenase